ncbi:ribonuclease [bacterium BMS3Abin03]|nr:ribonuclease [bacterium BMS3Abin03]
MIKFLPLGGANEIGANCYYLNLDETGILLDCGMHPRKTGLDALPDFNLLKDKPLDYVLITHAHQDHINSLPFLVKSFPHVKIVTTPQTRALAELTLHNAISILKRQINDDSFQIYSHEEVDLLIKSIDYKAYNEPFVITGHRSAGKEKVTAEFYDAGHVLGSAGILISYDNKKIFYTGDINLSSQTIISEASLPKTKVDILITECTYGATDSSTLNDWNEEVERFITSLNKILNRGGSVLIPVFSLGKMQEILATLNLKMIEGKLTETDIYTGGISKKINRVYDYNRYVVNRNERELVLHDIPQKNIYEINNTEDLFKYPSIVLASSGMMNENTMSFTLARRWLREKDSAIFTVGYMDEESPGFKFACANRGDKIKLSESEKETEVRCEINNFKFSAHARREELLEIVKMLKPGNVILVHGDEDAINWVGKFVLKMKKGIKVTSAAVKNEISFA